jgi:hypothetical protein
MACKGFENTFQGCQFHKEPELLIEFETTDEERYGDRYVAQPRIKLVFNDGREIELIIADFTINLSLK